MTTTRKTREDSARRKPWQPPSMLETPPAPDGYKFRWLRRTREQGLDDVQNVLNRERQGYEIVRPEQLKALGIDPVEYQTMDSGRNQGAIINGDLVLAMVHEETAKERTEHFERQSAAQLKGVHAELMRQNTSKMPLSIENKPLAGRRFAE